MIQRLLYRLFGVCPVCCQKNTYCQSNSCPSCSQSGENVSCLCRNAGCSPCDLDGYDIRKLCWVNVPICDCELDDISELLQNGFEEWRLDPVSVCAKFLSSSAVPCEFKGKPAFLKCKKCISGKTYVLFGVSCVGEVAFELDSKNFCSGKKIYTVCRVSYIC